MKRFLIVLSLCLLFPCGSVAADPVISPNPAVATFVTGAYITWTTDIAGTSSVDYGETTGYGSTQSSGTNTTLSVSGYIRHDFVLTGLSAGTTYHYRVTTGATVSGDFTFTTLSATGTVKTVKSSGGDYTSLDACMDAASPGWTCLTYNGATTGSLTPGASGEAGSPITALAYDEVTITGFDASGRSYVALKGFESTGDVTSTGGTTSYVTIDNNFFNGARISPADSVLSNNWTISNNIIYNTSVGIYVTGDSVLIDNNDISRVTTDCMYDGALTYSIIRRNVCHDYGPEGNGQHVDFFQTDGGQTVGDFGYVLFESNTAQRCVDGTGNCHFIINRDPYDTPTNMIIRYNFVQSLNGSGCTFGSNENILSNRINNNTFAVEAKLEDGVFSSYYANYTKSLNNLAYNTCGTDENCFDTGTGIVNNYNVQRDSANGSADWGSDYQDEATYATLKNLNPSFTNYPAEKTIASNSALIDKGGALTTVTSGCGGSSLVLADVRWFQPGWAGANADVLAIGTVTNTATITGISYSSTASTSSGTVTFASSVSCTNGDSVWLYQKSDGTRVLYGTAPDIGAYEYSSGVTYTVTGADVSNGSTSCTSPVDSGNTTTCTLSPSANYHSSSASSDTCGGSLSTNTYTTGAVTSNCIVTAVFAADETPFVGGKVTSGGTGKIISGGTGKITR